MPESVAALDQFSNIFNFPGGNSRSEFDAFRKSSGADTGPPGGCRYGEHMEDFWKPYISFTWNHSFSLICTHCSPFELCINRSSLSHEIPASAVLCGFAYWNFMDCSPFRDHLPLPKPASKK